MEVVILLIPVIIFLLLLMWIDGYKLIKRNYLVLFIGIGIVCTLFAFLFSELLQLFIEIYRNEYSYVSPIVEEIIKFIPFFIFYKLKKVAFIIDAIIYGFAIGCGFAISENIFYYFNYYDSNFMFLIIRGFGTSIMHSFAISIAAGLFVLLKEKNTYIETNIILSLISAIIIHLLFNLFIINPVVSTSVIIVISMAAYILIFYHNSITISKWINEEFDSEIELLNQINSGKVSNTKIGEYINSIKNNFSPLVVFDMLCLIKLNLELSIKAKANLMIKAEGLDVPEDNAVKDMINEYYLLKKSIGKTGFMALKPILPIKSHKVWNIELNK